MNKGIYLIESGGFYKIGITSNIKNRISSMTGNNPLGIEVLIFSNFNIDALDEFGENWAVEVEKRFHFYLQNYKKKLEWFDLPRRVLDDVYGMLWSEEYPEQGAISC